jgi:hypothetical protein
MIESLIENRRDKRRRTGTKAGGTKAGGTKAGGTMRPAEQEPSDLDLSETAPIYGLTRDQVANLIDEVVRGDDTGRRGDEADERVRAKR